MNEKNLNKADALLNQAEKLLKEAALLIGEPSFNKALPDLEGCRQWIWDQMRLAGR